MNPDSQASDAFTTFTAQFGSLNWDTPIQSSSTIGQPDFITFEGNQFLKKEGLLEINRNKLRITWRNGAFSSKVRPGVHWENSIPTSEKSPTSREECQTL